MDSQIFGYSRVSSDEQAQHGISIDAQRDILNAYGTMHRTTVRIYEDAGFSGKNLKRPALQRLLVDATAGSCSTVVVWKLDRLSRNLRDTLHIIEDVLQPAGVSLVSVTESIDTSTPSGRMMLNLLASFAQLEREQDSDRVVMAHKHLARDCRYLGGHVPLGYRIDEDKHYQLDPVTYPAVRRVFDLYLSRAGYSEILAFLNDQPLTAGTRKNAFTKQDLNFMLKNEIYAGTYVRKMGIDKRSRITAPEVIRVPGGVPAILSPEEWNRVCALREENRAAAAKYTARVPALLSGLVRCAVCGKLMPLNYGGKDRSGTKQRYYTCRSRCVKPARLERIEEAVLASLEYLSAHEQALRDSCAVANSYSDLADQDHAHRVAELNRHLAAENKKAAKIAAFIAQSGTDAPLTLLDELRAIETRQAKIKAAVASCSRPVCRYDPDLTVAAIRAAKDIKKQPPGIQRELIQAAVLRVCVTDTEFRILPAWHTCGGDEPPHPVCHVYPRS